ncbi:MAG: BTAD domain-containing putative transcriptional regulator [Trueperaceae bacterium]|nr:BTAD domain-containing putative transcriptional regulator [Trueperaceae bacterium]
MNVRLRLLGEVQVQVGGRWMAPPADKRLGLLGYLACADGWVERDRLAWLFWPDVRSSRARTNLRGLLSRTQREAYAQGLEAEPERLRWDVPHDVAAFRAALAREDWGEALRIYGGTFFGDAAWDGVGELGGWIAEQRERLRAEHRRAALACVAARPDGDAEVIDALDALLREDPFDEEVARHAIAARAAAGRRDEALRLAASLRARLREELDAAPSDATEQVIAELDRPPVFVSSNEMPDAAAALTPFVGRGSERRELAQRLARDDCRLLTLTGPGGVGKTRLARQLAQEAAGRYRDGAHLVDLAVARTAQDVATAVARGLNLSLEGDEAAEDAVKEALAGAEALLVLDDMDGALAAATWLTELLNACAGVTLLVTSRRRLEVPGEWVAPLAGLELPDEGASPEEVRAADAVRLFADAAARIEPSFVLNEDTSSAVLRICRLVGGLPLALELAAAWVRALPLGDLARELEKGIDLLGRTPHDDRDRHSSVRAAFEVSWQSLEPSEAEVFAALAVFRGPFGRDAAEAVAGANVHSLATLVDRSLLRLGNDGRYERHPLLRSFAREKLAERPELERRARERHVDWFGSWIEGKVDRFERTMSAPLAHDAVAAHADLSAVLEDAVASGDAELAARAASALLCSWMASGRSREGRAWVDRVRELPFPPGSPWEADMFRLAAVLGSAEGEDEGTRPLLEEGLRRARAIGDVSCEVRCLNDLSVAHSRRGDRDTASGLLDRALGLVSEEAFPAERMFLLTHAGKMAMHAGDSGRAHDLLAQGLAMAERHDSLKVMGLAHLHRGRLKRAPGRHPCRMVRARAGPRPARRVRVRRPDGPRPPPSGAVVPGRGRSGGGRLAPRHLPRAMGGGGPARPPPRRVAGRCRRRRPPRRSGGGGQVLVRRRRDRAWARDGTDRQRVGVPRGDARGVRCGDVRQFRRRDRHGRPTDRSRRRRGRAGRARRPQR